MTDLTPEQIAVLDECFFQWPSIVGIDIKDTAKFAHYTSARVAMGIIQGDTDSKRCLWLRNATLMNDFSEVEYGRHLLHLSLGDDALGPILTQLCNEIHPDIIQAFAQMGQESGRIKNDTFILSLALHQEENELARGKLSMWRAYGGEANVCILLEPLPFMRPQTAYDVNIAPVDYKGFPGFRNGMQHIVDAMQKHKDALKNIDPELVKLNLKLGIDNMVLSSKHPGFEEEKEWRVIKRRPEPGVVETTPSQIVDVQGVFQEVYYLPMKNLPDHGIVGAELKEILHRIIIGPTANPDLVRRAFVRALQEQQVENANDKVSVSLIPLRR